MTITLGIDTGGTYTDAVLVDHADGRVLAGAKALTTPDDLAAGIREAVTQVLKNHNDAATAAEIAFVGLSTTLATNAIVEGHGCSVGLLLIGYDPELIRQYGFEHDLVTSDVVYLRGKHNGDGDEVEPLDEAAARQAILERRDRVEAFAVSGYFGVRNPAHELRVRALVEELTRQDDGLSRPVTCGHELTTHLDSIRRATTAALNARLIPLLRELIVTVRRTLDDLGVTAPLMIVKGDGSLVRTAWAMRRPIETILSGPAASVVGAWHLAGRHDVWVVDIGGTTTDIAMLQDGRPRLNPEGAQVGRWQTMVAAVDIHTVGLGGDSHVYLNGKTDAIHGRIAIGPRRILPLSLLANQYPQILDELRAQHGQKQRSGTTAKFLLARRKTSQAAPPEDAALLDRLRTGPQPVAALANETRFQFSLLQQIYRLSEQQLIVQAGFTPTDALHVLGVFERWNVEAARLGAELLAAQHHLLVESFCRQVIGGVSDRVAAELVSKILSKTNGLPDWEREPAAVALLMRAFDGSHCAELDCRLHLKQPIIAIGAPVAAYLPRTARQLHTEAIIPDYAEVANAIGAVAGGVVQRVYVRVHFLETPERAVYRFYLPDGYRDFSDLDEGVDAVQQEVTASLKAATREAGAAHVEVAMTRDDTYVSSTEGAEDLYLHTNLYFTATGRPGLARNTVELSKYEECSSTF
jgi:N-methylhydantoinase A/oxoprolinase/acetone carboxylase beta subunit